MWVLRVRIKEEESDVGFERKGNVEEEIVGFDCVQDSVNGLRPNEEECDVGFKKKGDVEEEMEGLDCVRQSVMVWRGRMIWRGKNGGL